MRSLGLCLVVVWLWGAVGCDSQPPPPPPPKEASKAKAFALQGLEAPLERPATFRKGVSLGLFVSTDEPEQRRRYYQTFLDEIAALGATDVSLVVRWSQQDIRATEIAPRAGVTVEDAVLVEVIEMATKRGLRVFLLPILHLEAKKRGEWRGKLEPGSWERWWASYQRFILHYALLAHRAGVEMLAVGSELATAERYEARWRSLIKAVRDRYKGKLTYSANWDHFEPIAFWDALDVVGVTAYQELSKRKHPTLVQLVEGWKPFEHRLKAWARRHGHRYIFTEVGYPSNPHGAARPWDHREKGQSRPGLQLRCYQSLYKVWQTDPSLDGLYLWNWFGHGGLQDKGYTLRGKPAQYVIERWFATDQPVR